MTDERRLLGVGGNGNVEEIALGGGQVGAEGRTAAEGDWVEDAHSGKVAEALLHVPLGIVVDHDKGVHLGVDGGDSGQAKPGRAAGADCGGWWTGGVCGFHDQYMTTFCQDNIRDAEPKPSVNRIERGKCWYPCVGGVPTVCSETKHKRRSLPRTL